MKYTPATLLLFLLLTSFTDSKTSILGKWKGVDDGEVGFVTFDKDGFVTMEMDGGKMGGRKFDAGGVMASMTYEIDDNADPMTIDFVIRLLDEGLEVGRLPGIYKFVNNKTLIINMNFDGPERPARFDPEDPNQITMSRVK
jgi:hypothetical protein